MKQMLALCRSFTEKEYPQYVHLISRPDMIDLAKIENGGVITDTYNSAQKENRLISASINGVVHSMFCHNHLRNFWVNNVLDSLIEFVRAHLNDNIDEVSPELHVFPGFMSLAL